VNSDIDKNALLDVPDWIVDLPSFRRWVHSPEVPEKTRTFYLAGEVVVDASKEQLFTHNQLKLDFHVAVGGLARSLDAGLYFPNGILFSNNDADLASQPDGMFISYASFVDATVAPAEYSAGDYAELQGSPDLIVEVLSDASEHRDTVVLRNLHWQAGVREYWIADARKNRLSFEIMTSESQGFVEVANENGWRKSNVLGKEFRLSQRTDQLGHPEYVLDVR
jgi:hypothetical protein